MDPDEFTEDDFEPEPRKCNNCGEMKRMLKLGKAKSVY